MTDLPRFQQFGATSDDAHRHYHGGRLVDLVLSIADHWKAYAPEGQDSRTIDMRTSVHSLTHRAGLPRNRDGPG